MRTGAAVDSWMDEELDFVPDRAARSRTIVLGPPAHRDQHIRREVADIHGELRAAPAAEADHPRFSRATAHSISATTRARLGYRPREHSGAARRPRRRTADRVAHRPDRIVLWAVVLGALLILIAATSSQAQAATLTGKTLSLGSSGKQVTTLQLELKRLGYLKAKADSLFGRKTRTAIRRYQRSRCLRISGRADAKTLAALRGNARACKGPGATTAADTAAPAQSSEFGSRALTQGTSGDDVYVLQQLLGIARSAAYDDTTVQAVKRFQSAAGLPADGVAGAQTANALGTRMTQYVGTWYGPGLYGNRTACGQVLTESLQGTAHRTLPCGTKVTFFYNGRFRTVPVVDRGPASGNAAFDLTSATAKGLGLSSTVTLRAAF